MNFDPNISPGEASKFEEGGPEKQLNKLLWPYLRNKQLYSLSSITESDVNAHACTEFNASSWHGHGIGPNNYGV